MDTDTLHDALYDQFKLKFFKGALCWHGSMNAKSSESTFILTYGLPHAPLSPPTPQMYPWCVYSIYRVYYTNEYGVGNAACSVHMNSVADSIYVCMYVCTYVCMCVCVYVQLPSS